MSTSSEGGNVSVLLTAVIVVAILLCGAIAALGGAVAQKSRANNAADGAALAAANGLALGHLPVVACAAARRTAADNGARLLTCACGRGSADVTVAIGAARAHARAAVDVLERHEVREQRKSGARSIARGNLTNRAEPQ
jgi:secretion/DNA translocation related TadE-like protein